ncbi:galectin-2 [Microcaecilia unicolor]|uniref:Galectin n=1 Tax=Microcaecilia unicolor TaxID=1415580 RepID=A0A6P7YFI5_9AMPH|nr:galectin-2 [Microcaecilia unicolor]
MSKFEVHNLEVHKGQTVKIKGQISGHAQSFCINLGKSASDVGLHFNPRFSEGTIVCNSKKSNSWDSEERHKHMCFSKGSEVKFSIELHGDKFQVKLPDGHQISFANRHKYEKITYMSVEGDFKVTSFKYD